MMRKFSFYLLILSFIYSCQQHSSDKLLDEFSNPPASFKPWVYWYWIDENISKEGITMDLEAMARVGIGRALIGHVSPGNVRGEVRILSEPWWEMLEHAVREGQRTGVDLGFFNGPGWSQSGGPWISQQHAMRYVISNKFQLSGPSVFEKNMTPGDPLFKRIALQAFPAPENEMMLKKPFIEKTVSAADFPGIKHLLDGDSGTFFLFPENIAGDDSLVMEVCFKENALLQSMRFDFLPIPFHTGVTVQAGDDGGEYETIRHFSLDRRNINFEIGPKRFEPVTFTLPAINCSRIRLIFRDLTFNHGAGLKEITFSPEAIVDQVIEKQLGKMYSDPLPPWDAYLWSDQPEPDKKFVIDIDRIIDLTGEIDSTGNLRWRVPEGQWILLESGMIPTGATNVPVPAEATGYECDKFTEAAIETHFNAFVGKFLERVPADERKSFKTVVIDSYEVGPQNWTDDFRDVFRARFGYDPIPWLPVFGGHIVKSMDLSNRFLWDVRRLTADLIADVYVRRLREMSNEHGLELWMENYGHWGFPAEFLQYGGQADQVSGEFWFENHLWDLGPLECRAASSAAHTYGKKEVFAEAFTAGFNFLQYPAIMKSRGDQMFCEGINHFVQHVYIHQPWENRKPGVTAWFGMAYQRHNTWFGQSRAWNEYLQRCHFLLQQGLPVSDVCYFIGEDTPKMTGTMFPSLPAGFDFDFINADAVLNRLSVRDGALVLPDGKSYQLLILPPLKTMRPELLKKFGDLIGEGASIYGSPPTRSPSMENYPEADEKVKILAGEIWGETDGKTEIGKTAGSGRLFNRDRLEMVFKELDLVPDMICKDSGIHWTHRKQEDTDIYFLSNPDGAFKSLEISFRVTGKIPELWDPATGKMEKIAFFDRSDSRTSVPLNLDPHGSVFIIFREPVKENHIREMEIKRSKPLQGDAGNTSPRLILTGDGHLKLFAHLNGSYFLKSSNGELKTIDISGIPDPEVISGPWKIVFPGNRDVPVRFTFDSLISWTDHPDPGVRHFSGTGQYNKSLILPESMIHENSRLILDLGKVRMMAEVAVNGKDLGILWKEPFCVDITSAVRAGKNDIEIRITNTWWNRLVGDEKYPMGFPEGGINQPRTWTTTKAWNPESDLLPSGLLGPVRLHVEKEMVVW